MIAIAVVVPMMVVLDAAAVTVPVAMIEALSVVARSHPTSGRVHGTAPISGMPSIAAPNRIPVAV
jgi:hypothetical protein